MVNYSIIIPSKNLPDLLERALASIPRRDDIEIIVVDDASDPAIVDFARYPGLSDPAVHLILTTDHPSELPPSLQELSSNPSELSPSFQELSSDPLEPSSCQQESSSCHSRLSSCQSKASFSAPGISSCRSVGGKHIHSNIEIVCPRSGAGAGYVRNIGLARATGRWTLFLDCDDFFTPEAFALLDAHLNDDADIVYFNITSAYSDDLSYSPRHLARSEYFTAYTGAKRDFCCRYLYTEPWGKMFRTSFLKPTASTVLVPSTPIPTAPTPTALTSSVPSVSSDPFFYFDETPMANDFKFSIMTGIAAKKIVTDDRALCCITERRGSLSHDFCSTPEQLSTRLTVYRDVQSLLDAAGIKSYPFYKLVNFTLRHHRPLLPVLRSFCSSQRLSDTTGQHSSCPSDHRSSDTTCQHSSCPSDQCSSDKRPTSFFALRLKTFLLRLLFSRYHRRHWSIF